MDLHTEVVFKSLLKIKFCLEERDGIVSKEKDELLKAFFETDVE